MKHTVLVVDDEPDITELIRYGLTEDGFEVLTAGSEAEFRVRAANTPIDMFIFDLNLPDGSGLSLVKEVRRVSDVGIIILTGRASETDQIVGLEIGADDYVIKPFRMRELRARVNSVFRRTKGARYGGGGNTNTSAATQVPAAPSQPTPDIAFDGYAIIIGGRQVLDPQGREIDFTTSEFDLLVALASRRGQVMTREQLMNAIKGRDWESYDRAVDGLVSRIRRKIPAPEGMTHFIRTVHGVGYTFRT